MLISFLSFEQPHNGRRWLNLSGNFNCRQPHPADVDPYDIELRYIWFMCQGYFIRAKDADIFINWTKGVDFWDNRLPEPHEMYRMFLGEYGWAPAFWHFNQPYHGFCGWTNPGKNCPTSVLPVHFEYIGGGLNFDCSLMSLTCCNYLITKSLNSLA